eukprot:scaffold83182_cov58-Attheya_sp.AAC.1
MARHCCSRLVWIGSITLTASLGNILFLLRTTYNSIDVAPLGSAPPVALHTGVNTSQQDRTRTTRKYDLIPSIIEDTTIIRPTTLSRYLVYFSHSGFANQIVGLRNAAILAYSTNRTLVLQPLLPHTPKDTPKIFKNYKSQAAGPRCKPYKHDAKFIEIVKRGAADAAGDGQLFPSFSELVDFDEIEKRSGIHFVDLPDFMNEKNHSTKFWHEGNRRKVEYDGECTLNYTRTYPDMVKVFEDNFSTDPTIAVIGSAFIINNKPENLGFSDEQLFFGFPPSKK